MKVYLLQRKGYVRYDEYVAKVITANSPKRARELANLEVGGEGSIWTDVTLVSCKEVKAKKEEVVLESFQF